MKIKRDTEQLIRSTLLDMLESESFFNIKVTDLVDKAGISRSAFYVYFDSIYDVLQKIEDDYMECFPGEQKVLNIVRGWSEKSGVEHEELYTESSQYTQENMRIYRLLSGPNGDPSFYYKHKNRVTRITHDVVGKGATQKDDNYKKLTAAFLAGGNVAIFDWWAHHPNGIEAEEFSKFAFNLYADLIDCIQKRK